MIDLVVHEFNSTLDGRKFYNAIIDDVAGAARTAGVTRADFQQTVYLDKLAEARVILEEGDNYDPSNSVWLADEAEDSGVSLQDYAQLVVDKNNQWQRRTAAIEIIRLRAKAAIRNTTDFTAMYNQMHKAITDMDNIDQTL